MRCPPLSLADFPKEIEHMKEGFAGRLNVYRVMAHHPALVRAWATLREHVVLANSLGAQHSEVAILRTGYRMEADYEWAHHISRARACGMSDVRIASIAGPLDAMSPEDAVVAGAVDALVDAHHLPEAQRAALEALVGLAGTFDLMATVGFYATLAFIVRTFDTPLDEDVAVEMEDRPLRPQLATSASGVVKGTGLEAGQGVR